MMCYADDLRGGCQDLIYIYIKYIYDNNYYYYYIHIIYTLYYIHIYIYYICMYVCL